MKVVAATSFIVRPGYLQTGELSSEEHYVANDDFHQHRLVAEAARLGLLEPVIGLHARLVSVSDPTPVAQGEAKI